MIEYLENCWYMAGWASEVIAGAVLARRICDLPIVLFRHENRLHALLDTCPHRFAPLSRGKLVGGTLACGYHGLTFDGSGACIRNPHGAITGRMKVRAFPAVERYKALWIWLGEPGAADPALIPDFSFQDEDMPTAISFGYLHGNCDYRLYIDNIMDLSHIDFLHADTLGGGSIVSAKRQIYDTERSLTVRWSQSGFPPSPLHVSLGSCSADAKLDRITEVIWYPPGAMVLTNGFAPMGAAEHEFWNSIGAHIMVPETSGTLHYFYSTTRNFKKDDAQFNATYAQRRDHVFLTEDGPMLEAVQSRMGSHELFDLRPLLLKTDEPAIRVRRKLEAMIRAEHTVDADTTGRVEDSLV